MRKIAVWLVLSALIVSVFPQHARAVSACQGVEEGINVTLQNGVQSHKIVMDFDAYPSDQDYVFRIKGPNYTPGQPYIISSPSFRPGQNGADGSVKVNGNIVTWTITEEDALVSENNQSLDVEMHKSGILYDRLCDVGSYKTAKFSTSSTGPTCEIYVYQKRNGRNCYSSGCLVAGGVTTYIEASGLKEIGGTPYTGEVLFDVAVAGWAGAGNFVRNASNGVVEGDFETRDVGTYSVILTKLDGLQTGAIICKKFSFITSEGSACENLCGEKVSIYEQESQTTPNFDLCKQTQPGSEAEITCIECLDGTALNGKVGVWTAIGCIPTEPTSIIQTLITLGLSLGGGVTLLLILAGAFRLSVSAGDPKQAEEAKEQITSAVIGLLFIIFSVVMLRFIGVQVLQIPGFGG